MATVEPGTVSCDLKCNKVSYDVATVKASCNACDNDGSATKVLIYLCLLLCGRSSRPGSSHSSSPTTCTFPPGLSTTKNQLHTDVLGFFLKMRHGRTHVVDHDHVSLSYAAYVVP